MRVVPKGSKLASMQSFCGRFVDGQHHGLDELRKEFGVLAEDVSDLVLHCLLIRLVRLRAGTAAQMQLPLHGVR